MHILYNNLKMKLSKCAFLINIFFCFYSFSITLSIFIDFIRKIAAQSWINSPEILDDNLHIIGDTFIILKWKEAKNSGFHFSTEIHYSQLNTNNYANIQKFKLYPYQIDTITDIFAGIFLIYEKYR